MSAAELEDQLKGFLIGKICWYVLAGGCTGSVFDLYLGQQYPRVPIDNDALPVHVREHEPEFSLLVRCAWRLDGQIGPITGWCEPNGNDDPLVLGLLTLVDSTITNVSVVPTGLDLILTFSNGSILRIFCDLTRNVAPPHVTNWSLFHLTEHIGSVEPSGVWRR